MIAPFHNLYRQLLRHVQLPTVKISGHGRLEARGTNRKYDERISLMQNLGFTRPSPVRTKRARRMAAS